MTRRRLDAELVRRGLVVSRAEAQHLVSARRVLVAGAVAEKPARLVDTNEPLLVTGPPARFVSRGGEKLEHALEHFGIDVRDRRVLDVGASTGGFTDCLLQHGAAHVIGYDVGYGQVHERLRSDTRVTVFERTNVRALTPDDVPPPPPTRLVADLSFISLRLVLPVLRDVIDAEAEGVVLVKPQFEATRAAVGRGGVVRDPGVWAECLDAIAELAVSLGWPNLDVAASPLLGPAGNVEFLLALRSGPGCGADAWVRLRQAALAEGEALVRGASRHDRAGTDRGATRPSGVEGVPGVAGSSQAGGMAHTLDGLDLR